jgi:hypothetical protein
MTRRTRFAVGGVLLVAALAVVLPAAVMAGPDGSASVQFGNPDIGSPSDVGPPPLVLHDASANAQFNLVPRTTVIADDGQVTFTIGTLNGLAEHHPVPHQVAVCALGMTPDDVNVAANGTPFINDDRCPRAGPPSVFAPEVKVEFNEPGRYLVLCNIRGHFTSFDMYGWVDVK